MDTDPDEAGSDHSEVSEASAMRMTAAGAGFTGGSVPAASALSA